MNGIFSMQPGSPLGNLFASGAVGQLGAGLLSGNTMGQGLGLGFQGANAALQGYQQQQKAKAQYQGLLSGAQGLTPQQRAVLGAMDPAKGIGILSGQAFKAPTKGIEINGRLVNPLTGEELGNFSDPEAFTLSPGQKRFEGGEEVASVDPAAPKPTFQKIGNQLVRIGPDGTPSVVHTAPKDTQYKVVGSDLVSIPTDGTAPKVIVKGFNKGRAEMDALGDRFGEAVEIGAGLKLSEAQKATNAIAEQREKALGEYREAQQSNDARRIELAGEQVEIARENAKALAEYREAVGSRDESRIKIAEGNLRVAQDRAKNPAPTAKMRNLEAAGIMPDDPRYAKAMIGGGTTVNVAGAEKPFTETQSKMALFSNMMDATGPVIKRLQGQLTAGDYWRGAAGDSNIANALVKTPEFRQYQSLGRQWAEGLLRIQTGAAATESEIVRVFNTYFPQPGDDAGTIALKEQQRVAAESAIKTAMQGRIGDPVAADFSTFAPEKVDDLPDPVEGGMSMPVGGSRSLGGGVTIKRVK